MVGTKLPLLFLAAAVLFVSAQEQRDRHARPGSYSRPQNSRPNGNGNGNGNGYNQGYGQQYPKPQQQQQPSPYPGGIYVNPNLPQISPPYIPGQYVNPSLPQVSPPGPMPWNPQNPNPSRPQTSRPQISNPDQYDSFINRTRLDLDDIKARAERDIYDAQQEIGKNDDDIYMLAENDVQEAAKLLDLHNDAIARAVGNGKDGELLNGCIDKARATMELSAYHSSQRTKSCIETANIKAIAIIDRAETNLALDAQQAKEKFEKDSDKLKNCPSQNNRAALQIQLQLINRNVAQFASDAENQVNLAQAAASKHSADSAVCRTLQNQNQRDTKTLAKELVNDCIVSTPDVPEIGTAGLIPN